MSTSLQFVIYYICELFNKTIVNNNIQCDTAFHSQASYNSQKVGMPSNKQHPSYQVSYRTSNRTSASFQHYTTTASIALDSIQWWWHAWSSQLSTCNVQSVLSQSILVV